MKKLLLILGLALPLLASAQTPTPDPVPTPNAPPAPARMPMPAAPQLGATSYILVDYDSGRVLVEHDPDKRLDMASITKVMTTYVVFKELASGNITLADTVPISETAWRTGGTRMFIEPSMTVNVEQLLLGVIIQSGNDASVALAELLGGSEEAFAGVMNHYAEELGMTNTHFMNATGLPHEDHYSSAHDLAILSAALIREFPDDYPWFSQKEFTFNDIRQHNRNNLLWRDPAVDGLKTGHTEAAGYCLASSAKRDGMRLIAVVMGSASEQARASESQALLNYGFRFFETVQLYRAGDELAKARVWKGEAEEVTLGVAENMFVTIPRGSYDSLEATVHLQPELMAPLALGAEVGRIDVKLGDEQIADTALLTREAVPAAGFFGRAWDGFKLWSGGLFSDDEE
jgi:D-alanyl-D-alanine carboxypeptidase (penicillin-binding protein 5/6)